MTVLYYVAMFLHIAAALFLIGVVLLQHGKGQDLASAFGGGGTQTAFGPRGSANVLSRATAILAGLFMVTSLTLSLVRPKASSFLDQAATPSPAPTTETRPAAPSAADDDATASPESNPEQPAASPASAE